MSVQPRQPRVFTPNDPTLVVDDRAEFEAASPDPTTVPESTRPTLSDLSRRGLRWGTLLAVSLGAAFALGTAAWFARFVSVALARDDWMGMATLIFLMLAALAALMITVRELIAFARLSRLARLRREIAAALGERDQQGERLAGLRLAAFYSGRRELAWAITRFREYAGDIHDPGDLLALADREIMAPLDVSARSLVTRSAKRVATVTALSPIVLIAVGYVLIENLRLLRALGALYGARPGFVGVVRLARLVLMHIVATGGIAMTDDLLGQFLGQDLLRRVSRRLGEGAFNGALTARIGVTALEVIRPLPFLAAKPPRVRDVLAEALKPLFMTSRARAP